MSSVVPAFVDVGVAVAVDVDGFGKPHISKRLEPCFLAYNGVIGLLEGAPSFLKPI